jgi:hypothetical protein
VELRRADRMDVASMREERMLGSSLGVVPGFYSHMVAEAEAFIVEEPGAAGEASAQLGYVLLLERPHGGHSHVTLIELHLAAAHQTRYEDVLDLVKDTHKPTAYLARTDDCRFNATLLARGHQMEATALVMLPEQEGGSPLPELPGATGIHLAPFTGEHLAAAEQLIEGKDASASVRNGDGEGSPGQAVIYGELEALAGQGRSWVVHGQGRPLAVIARVDGGDGTHELLDFVVARAGDAELSQALRLAGDAVRMVGHQPAAVIDARETARRRIFRKAGYYSAAAYMVFYDPETGRPSVGILGVTEVQAMLERKERFRLVDVLGEEHWKEAHLPGSEWIDFRGLAREARRRFDPAEPIVLYCNGFT